MKTLNKTIRILIEGKEHRLSSFGFSSPRNLHDHFFKHVVRIHQAKIQEDLDPERWHELLAERVDLIKDLDERRQWAKKKLRVVNPQCALASKAPTSEAICGNCKSTSKIFAVGREFSKEIDAYQSCVIDQLRSALEAMGSGFGGVYVKKGQQGPTLVALGRARVLVKVWIKGDSLQGITAFRPCSSGRIMSYVEQQKYFADKRRAAKVSRKELSFQVLKDEQSGGAS